MIVLTQARSRSMGYSRQNGAYAYFVKRHTSGEDLDKAIQRAVAFVGRLPKEDRYRAI